MMIDGRKRLYYSDNILVRIEPEFRQAVAEAAARENTTMSEIIRRGVRAALTQPANRAVHEAAGAAR